MNVTYTEERPPASAKAIKKIIDSLGFDSSNWLVNFWALHDGAMLNGLVLIYSTDEILERNKQYEINLYFPGYFLVGDDSGGRLLLMKKNVSAEFFLIDAGNPFLGDALPFNSISEVLSEVCASGGDEFEFGDIVSVGADNINSSDLLFLKKELGFPGSITDLRKKLLMEGEVIVADVSLFKYQKALASCGNLIRFIG
jgi:hypothetical protein